MIPLWSPRPDLSFTLDSHPIKRVPAVYRQLHCRITLRQYKRTDCTRLGGGYFQLLCKSAWGTWVHKNYPVDLYPAYLSQATSLIRYSIRKVLNVTKIKLDIFKTFKRSHLLPLNTIIFPHNTSVHSSTHLSHRGTSSQIPWRQRFGSCIRNHSLTANSTFLLFGNRQHIRMSSGAKTCHLLSVMQCYVLPKNKNAS